MAAAAAPIAVMPPAVFQRLLVARATALGIEHAWTQCAALPDGAECPDLDGMVAMAVLWPEHDALCECQDCEDVVEAYEVAYLMELDTLAEEEEAA